MKGLIIDEPWISLILAGKKDWEMRSRPTHVRGPIALIRKGSGQVVGTATVIGNHGPLGLEELRSNASRHCVPMVEFESGRATKWTTAWQLGHAAPLAVPVSYEHPFGAVIWVNLDPEVAVAIQEQRASSSTYSEAAVEHRPSLQARTDNHTAESAHIPAKAMANHDVEAARTTVGKLVPVAKDGSWFGPHVGRGGVFQIGEKGAEIRVTGYEAALAQLRTMSPPRWRRPNGKGNWGIVSGIDWIVRPA